MAGKQSPVTVSVFQDSAITIFLHRLRKRKGLIALATVLTVFLTMTVSFMMKPVYKAEANILIEEESQKSPLTGERTSFQDYSAQRMTFNTHFKVIVSDPVLTQVLKKLNLKEDNLPLGPLSEFYNNLRQNVSRLAGLIKLSKDEGDNIPRETKVLAKRISLLRQKIEIGGGETTRLMVLEVEDTNPDVAAQIANVLANTYIRYDANTKLESSEKMMSWLQDQLFEVSKKVEEAEKKFLAYKEREGLFSVQDRQKMNVAKIEDMNSAFMKSRAERMELEAKVTQLDRFLSVKSGGGQISSMPTFLKNSFLDNLYTELVTAQIEKKRLSGVYKRKHPRMLEINSKISGLSTKIREEILKARQNLKAEVSVIKAREKALRDASTAYETEAISTNKKELEYTVLERDVQTNRELYNLLLGKIKEANVMGGINQTNLRLVMAAAVPTIPTRPQKAQNFLLSLVMGLLLGILLALVLESMDQTIHNREEAERALQVPVLAEIPLLEKSYRKVKGDKNQKSFAFSVMNLPLNNPFSEAYRILATNLTLSTMERRRGVFLVTSATPGEGKSTTALNLGQTLAMQGMKTVVLEGDLRLPAAKRAYPSAKNDGLTDIMFRALEIKVERGALGELSVADLHQILDVQEKTGVLTYQSGEHTFMVHFLRGRIIEVGWPTRPADDRLGSLLVRSGLLTLDQVNVGLAKQKSSSQRLGTILLRLGFMKVEDLVGPLKLMSQENLNELYRIKSGEYHFEATSDVANGNGDPIERALADGVGHLSMEGYAGRSHFFINEIQERLDDFGLENFGYLRAGKGVPDPASLIASRLMNILMGVLRENYDVVVVDSPPAAMVSDTTNLATLCDGMVVIIKAAGTHIKEVSTAMEQLNNTQTRMLGTVINMLDYRHQPSYYMHMYGKYGGKYGYGQPKS
jgi:succinoglycan biosynthesis transport protein ExoP